MAQRRAAAARRGAVLITAAVVPLMLTACGTSADSSSSQSHSVVLQRPAALTNDTTVYDKIFRECEESTGITIKTQDIPQDGYLPKVLSQLSSKTLPDVLMLDNGDVQQIASSGALSPLTDFGVKLDGFAEGAVQAGTFEGKQYAMQPVANTVALFYNKGVLAAAGVTPPTTWDELKAAAAKLKSSGTYGVAFSAPASEEGTYQFLPFMWSNGGDEKNIASDETAAALQLWTDLVASGSAPQSVLNWTQADVNDQFIAGKVAMMVNGPWQIASLDKAGVDYGIAAIPAPAAGKTIQSPLGGETWTVPNTGNKSRQQDAAKVVECIGSDAHQLANAVGRNLVPTKLAIKEEFVKQAPSMKGFADQVPGLRSRTGELGTEWPKTSKQISGAIQTALTGGAAPLDALKQAKG